MTGVRAPEAGQGGGGQSLSLPPPPCTANVLHHQRNDHVIQPRDAGRSASPTLSAPLWH